MISSLIDVYKARTIKSKALTKYNSVVESIKKAAARGEDGCYVSDSLITFEIGQRLTKDGFDYTTNCNNDSMTWIYWG